jgi:hypothetical protein
VPKTAARTATDFMVMDQFIVNNAATGWFQHRSFGVPTKAADDVGKTHYLVELLDREMMD